MQRALLALFMAMTAVLSGCDGNGITEENRLEIKLTPAVDTLIYLEQLQLDATVTTGGQPTTALITWASSDSMLVWVTQAGLVMGGQRLGSATITARSGSAEASATIVVDSLREIRVLAPTQVLGLGDTVNLSAVWIGVLRTTPLDKTLIWSASNPAVATVDSAGKLIARSSGTVTITARQDLHSGSITLAVLPPGFARQAVCSGAGTNHFGVIARDTWRAADNPHMLLDSVIVDDLTIEPGAVVCGLPNSRLIIGSASQSGSPLLIAQGTSGKPIRFTAADPSQKWYGIATAGAASISHAIVESTTRGITARSGGLMVHDSDLDGADVSGCEGGHFAATLSIVRTVVESADACIIRGTFEDNVVRRGGLIIGGDRGAPTLTVNGGRIENSPGIALIALHGTTTNLPTISSTRPLRIINSASYPVDATLKIFARIWPTRASQDSLLGNAKDTLALWGNGGEDWVSEPLLLRSDLPWLVYYRGDYFPSGVHIDELTIEPGAALTLNSALTAHGSVSALGTRANPIRISGRWDLMLTDSGSSVLSYVNFTGSMIGAEEQHTLAIDHIDSDAWIQIASPGSSISDSRVHDVGASQFGVGPGAITIRASGIRVFRTDVVDNRRDGIHISTEAAADVAIHETNLVNNDGFGIRNVAGFQVDARRNWWGDPAGPTGPAGDGVSGNVDTSEWLFGPRP